MNSFPPFRFLLSWFLLAVCSSTAAFAAELELLSLKPDPYGYPRPAPGAVHVPVRTSLFFQLGFKDKGANDEVLADSVAVRLRAADMAEVEILSAGQKFAQGYSGQVTFSRQPQSALVVYIDSAAELRPLTKYTVSVSARSREGAELGGERGSWQFTTAAAEGSQAVEFALDLAQPAARWQGGFFTGFCKPSFCTSASNRLSSYELMNRVREATSPRAWSLQRDFSPTSAGHQPEFLEWSHPNVVRERETRRITDLQPHDEGILLRLEDFFGHEQYGIASNRPLAEDYHEGDEVLIADGVSDARTRVIRIVSDTPDDRSLLVGSFPTPADGWKIEYARPLPAAEDPHAPGLFPAGGCYLRKFKPVGTPHYYWGRLDQEWDIAVRQFGRRLVVNFTDAPGDLAVDGRQWIYPKDYAEYHEVVRQYTSHLIERYGDACLDFVWSVCNEADLAAAFWRGGDWIELQKFYDYTVDGVLRSFEDHGYDSQRVIVGGLEIGAIFGTHIEQPILKKFLCHCSPRAACEGELPLNAAMADRRLEGKRSQRVTELCQAWDGKGSPCDFISVHTYNAAPLTAAKLRRAKELALEIDAEFFADLWVNSFESCPNWAPPPDVAAADSYLGNGYFSTWCADVIRRQLAAAAMDARYGFGETILTFWPWPNGNFRGHNDAGQVIAVDDNGDGQKDREVAVALPVLHFLGLVATMTDRFQILPEQTLGGHVVSGFASRADHSLRLVVYSHDPLDVQSRSGASFEVQLSVKSLPWQKARVRQYRFDQEHNSIFPLARQLRDRPVERPGARHATAEEVAELLAAVTSDDPAVQLAAIEKATNFSELPEAVLTAAFQLHQNTKSEEVRSAIEAAGRKVLAWQQTYNADEVARIEELSRLRTTQQAELQADNGTLSLSVALSGNGANFIVIEPAD